MKCRALHLFTPGWLLLWALAGPGRPVARAELNYLRQGPQEPRWFAFHLAEVSAGVYAEGNFEHESFQNSGTTVDHEYLFVGPLIGLNADGSIYHPNLLRYYLNAQGAFGWGHDTFSGDTTATRDEFQWLGSFAGTVDLLENKPYHAQLFVNNDHTYRDNDFFNRVTVDSFRYGARATWEVGQFIFSADYAHRDEKTTSEAPYTQVVPVTTVVNGTPVTVLTTNVGTYNQPSTTHEDTVSVAARNERARGGSNIRYGYNRYSRTDGNTLNQGDDQTVAVSDSERFGPNDRYKLNANLSYFIRDTTQEKSDELSSFANATIEHTPNLNSAYDVNYDHYGTDGYNSDNFSTSASLQHQLYESLTSTLMLRASDFEVSDAINEGYTRRLGGGFAESYTKRLAERTRLRLRNSFFLEHTEQETIGTVRNETHSFSENRPEPNSFVLNLRNVIPSSIVVTDTSRVRQYLPGIDYEVIQFGAETEIHKVTGSAIPDVVVVSYQSEPTPTGGYDSITDVFEARVEFWNNLLAVYGRINLSLNNAPTDLRIQEITSYTAGTEFTWRWFRAGAEYQVYDSTDADYRTTRLYQSVSFHPDDVSSVSLDCYETWINYIDPPRQETDDRFILRYHRMMTRRLAVDLQGGVALRTGPGVDQTLATVRPSLKYVIGKTTIDVSYNWEYELFLDNEERQTQMFTFRLKRIF